MPETEDGLQRVDVREMWAHEADNFTPWLADHIGLLGAELGLTLKRPQKEVAVGPYFLDILAETPSEGGNPVRVAIENQLEWSDLQHLGQLLTYATGLRANIAVWVAPEFRRQLAEALHRLNEWTQDEIRFYAVRVEVFRRQGSGELEPQFHKVVWPGGWDEDSTSPDQAMSARSQLYGDFFRPLRDRLLEAGFATGARQLFDHTGRFFTPGIRGRIGYAASLEGQNDAWVTVHIGTNDAKRSNRIFDELHASRDEIEAAFAQLADRLAPDEANVPELDWRRHDQYTFSSISIRRDGSIHDPPEELEELRRWMLTHLQALKAVFDPRIEEILDRL